MAAAWFFFQRICLSGVPEGQPGKKQQPYQREGFHKRGPSKSTDTKVFHQTASFGRRAPCVHPAPFRVHTGFAPTVRRVLIANRYESFEPWLRSPPPSRISSPAAPLGTGEVAGKPLSRRPPRASGHQHHFFSLQTVHIFYRLSGLPDMRPMAAGLLKKQRGFREGTVSSGAPSFRSNTKVH
jgi:hypothetical protein